jgi:hypothetical protein
MVFQVIENFNGVLPMSVLGGNKSLVLDIQSALASHGYLDPPADGLFGAVSAWALQDFVYRQGLSLGAGFNKSVARVLLEPIKEFPHFLSAGNWISRQIQFALSQGHWFSRHPLCWNILYVEGIEPDGTLNNDAPNRFNDLRIVFRLNDDGALEFHRWEGTTEPGTYWTEVKMMNPHGAARIKFGQYKAWRVGIHNNNHEGLRQVLDVSVHRDLNKDYSRLNDKVQTGVFFINQHWGYDAPKNDLGNSSAGCLVGRTKSGHIDFMSLLKKDARYLASSGYTFMSSIIPGNGDATV